MALEVFNFPYHTVEGENPESGFRASMGGSYTFTTPPTDPDQRIFTLHFPAMKYYTDGDGAADASVNPTFNMLTLLQFYYDHKLYKSFQYTHPVHGVMEVKFNKPCPEPEGIPGANGVVKEFSINIVEIP